MNYEKLKKKMDLEHFLENKKIIDKIFKNKEDNIDFISDFKKDLAARNNDILSIYFKLNYFPNDFKLEDDVINEEIETLLYSDEYHMYNGKHAFLSELYKLIKKNNIELESYNREKIKKDYNTDIKSSDNDVSLNDINPDLLQYSINGDKFANVRKYILDKYGDVSFNFNNEVKYLFTKYFIDKYGVEESLKKINIKDDSSLKFTKDIYEFNLKNNFLFSYDEMKNIFDNTYKLSKLSFVDIVNCTNYIKKEYPTNDFNNDIDLQYGFIKYYIDKYGMDKAVESLDKKNYFWEFKGNILKFLDYYNNDNLLKPMEKKELFAKIYEDEIDKKTFKIDIDEDNLDIYNKEADICQILNRWGYGDCTISEKLGYHLISVPVNQICDANSFYDSWAEKINEYNLSPLEKYFYVYYLCKNYKEYKFFDESEERDKMYYNISRNPYLILDNEYEVCAGYAAMTGLLLGRLNDDRLSTFDLGVEQFNIAKQKMEYHARVGVYIEDTKYGIKSAYIGDPTFDSRNKKRGLYKTNHMFMKFETIQSDGWKITDVENNESFHKDKDFPYQEIDENTFISLATNVVYKTQKDLPDKAKRDMAINFITDRYRKGDKFNKIGDIKNYFDKLTDNLPISDIKVNSRLNDIAINFRCYDKKFIKDITQSGMYTVIDSERERVQFVLTSNNKKQVENVAFDLREKYDNLYDDNKNMPSARK